MRRVLLSVAPGPLRDETLCIIIGCDLNHLDHLVNQLRKSGHVIATLTTPGPHPIRGYSIMWPGWPGESGHA